MCVKAGCIFFVFVRRIYMIIIGRRGGYVGCFFLCRGCRRLSKSTVIDRFYRSVVRCACSRTFGWVGFVDRVLRLVGTCCFIGVMRCDYW